MADNLSFAAENARIRVLTTSTKIMLASVNVV